MYLGSIFLKNVQIVKTVVFGISQISFNVFIYGINGNEKNQVDQVVALNGFDTVDGLK